MNSSHKKELWLFAYKSSIWIFLGTQNSLRGDVTYFLWHGTLPSYKHINIWGVKVYIINGCVTRNKIDDRSHRGYFVVYVATMGVIIYFNLCQTFVIHISHHVWFDEYNSCLSIEDKHTPISLLLRKDPTVRQRDRKSVSSLLNILNIIFIIQTYST